MRLKLNLSEKCRRDEFVNSCRELPAQEIMEVPVSELTLDARKVLFGLPSETCWNGSQHVISFYKCPDFFQSDIYPAPSDWSLVIGYLAEKQKTEKQEKLNAILREGRAEIEAGSTAYCITSAKLSEYEGLDGYYDLDVLKAENSRLSAKLECLAKIERARREAEQRARDDAAKEFRLAQEADKREWIDELGSVHLQLAVSNGYDCQRLYVTERAAKEFPSFAVDFGENADWKDRSCPSPAALAEAVRAGGTVVWLTEPSKDLRDAWKFDVYDSAEYECDVDPFTPCEAVMVRFLSRYNLFQLFD